MVKFLSKYLFISPLILVGAISLAGANDSQQGPPPLTDAQKKCFTDNGVPVPEIDTPPPSQDVIDKIRTCLDENGFKPPTGDLPTLTDAQKRCFTDNGVSVPDNNTPRPSQDVIDKIRACLDANGFKPPT